LECMVHFLIQGNMDVIFDLNGDKITSGNRNNRGVFVMKIRGYEKKSVN